MKAGLLARMLGRIEKRNHPSSHEGWDAIWGTRGSTHAGVEVTPEGSLSYPGVFACVRVLAESVASLPLLTYERRPDGGKEKAKRHRIYRLLHDAPNPEMSSFEWRETMMGHVCTWGNGYSEVQWDRDGQVVALWPLRPDRMGVERAPSGALRYRYSGPHGAPKLWPSWKVLHLRSLSGNGLVGYSPIRLLMNSVGLGMATEEYGSRFFGNGARPGGILTHPGRLSTDAKKNLKETFAADHGGLANSHRLKVLEEGLTYTQIGIPPEEAQFLETRKFQLNEICRIYRVPPHLVADLERATFSNIEHQSIDFVVHTLRPWLVRIEQAITRTLMTVDEQDRYFVEFLVDGLMRGDIKSRYEAYSIGRQNGWLNANEIRSLENMNPVDGGDEYWKPSNILGNQTNPAAGSAKRQEKFTFVDDFEVRVAALNQRLDALDQRFGLKETA